MARRKDRTAEAAAMFAVTSMSSEEISAAAIKSDQNFIDSKVKEAQDAELEKIHEEEIAEAKSLGIEDNIIVESTTNEITRDLENKLEESQNRYLELVEEKDKLKEQIELLEKEKNSLLKENKISKQTILTISSDFDLFKTDSSREIANYKIEIDDLKEQLELHKYNEASSKLEVSKLRDEISNLEHFIKKNNLSKQNVPPSPSFNMPPNHGGRMYFKPDASKNATAPSNGYTSWN